MVSFDVTSLFTNVPLDKTIEIILLLDLLDVFRAHSDNCLSIAITLFLERVLVLVVATTTSNRSILLIQIFWSFTLPVFYRSSAEYFHENIQWICWSKPACFHNQQPEVVVFSFYPARFGSGCYVLPKGNPRFCLALRIQYIFS